MLAEAHGAGAKVLLLGGEGLRVALVEAGLEPVEDPDGAVAVASGYGPDVRWRDIMRVSTLVRDGLPYVASNADMTIPTPYGLAPGHGVLVQTDRGLRRRGADGGRQAREAADGGDGAAGGRGPADHGRRPARHRHRGRARHRRRRRCWSSPA